MDISNIAALSGLTSVTFRITAWWQGIDQASALAALVLLAVVVIFRQPLGRAMVRAISSFFKRQGTEVDQSATARLEQAARALLIALASILLLETLQLPNLADGVLRNTIISAALVAVFLTWYELAGNFVTLLKPRGIREVTLEDDWTIRVTRFAIMLFGVTALLEVWNVDISGAVTGVGVLGAGLAIAAQDLVRNLIAGMTNQSEERFVTGDAIEIEGGTMGTVEKIDLRSTLVLGFDQVPRHVPNAVLSNSTVRNYSRMAHRRVLVTIPLVLSSSVAQIKAVCDDLQRHLNESGDFRLTPEMPQYVHVIGISERAVEIQFYAVTHTGSYTEYLDVMQRLTLRIMEVVEAAGTELAYPTQTVHLANAPEEASA